MKVLVTGGAGFIGSQVAKALVARGDDVVIVDNVNDYYDPTLKEARLREVVPESVPFYKVDITDYEALSNICKEHNFDAICHLAAQAGVRYSLQNPHAYEQTNNQGTLNMLELARHNGIKNVIYASSSSVYGGNTKVPFAESDPVEKPISLYAATKRANELMAYTYHHLYGLNCTGLRFFTVYGPYGRPDMALFLFTKAILENKAIDVFNYGDMERDFTYVDDIVAGVLAAIDKSCPYEIFNLGGDHPVKLSYFIECIEKKLGKEAEKNLLPIQPGDVPRTMADLTKAKKILGFNPQTKIEEGIHNFIVWYKEFYKQ